MKKQHPLKSFLKSQKQLIKQNQALSAAAKEATISIELFSDAVVLSADKIGDTLESEIIFDSE